MPVRITSILKDRPATLHWVAPHVSAHDAVALMAEKGIAAVLVMEDGQLRGVFSGKDYVTRVSLQALDGREIPVRDVMTSAIIAVDPAATVTECMKVVTAKRIRHLPIVENDEVVGLVTLADLVRHQLAHKQFEIDQLIRYIGS
jgi:CBS domain-containing protein